MKTLPTTLQTHLDSGTTTLAWCWRLTRNDDAVFGFTDHDLALSFDGTSFTPESGFAASEIRSGSDLAVDSQDAVGVLTATTITETDILDGRWDNASVEIWRVNWVDTSQRVMMRRGAIGQVRRGRLHFVAEMRSLAHVLGQTVGRTFQASCDAALGDTRCGVNLNDPAFKGSGTVASPVGDRAFTTSGLTAFSDGWFSLGVINWTSGVNAGRLGEVLTHVIAAATGPSYAAWVGPQTMNFESGVIPSSFVFDAAGASVAAQADAGISTTKAMKFRTILNSQSTWFTLTQTYAAATTLTMRTKASSELNYDFFTVYLDGVQQFQSSGTPATFTANTIAIGTGSHVLKCEFTKDGSVSVGDDTAYISELAFVAASSNYVVGDKVEYLGVIWICAVAGNTSTPGTNNDWTLIGPATATGTAVIITLLEAPVRPIIATDTFTITAGCDKTFETCKAKFANTANFRGFPHIPGQDTIIRYAAKGGANSGTVL